MDPSGLEPFNSSGLLAEPKFLPGGTPNPNFVPFTSGNPSDFAFSNRQLANGAAFGTGVGIGVLTPPLPLAQATLLVLGSSAIELKVFDLVRGEDSSLQEFGLNGLYALGGEAIGIGLRAFGRTGARYFGIIDEACEAGTTNSIKAVNPARTAGSTVSISIVEGHLKHSNSLLQRIAGLNDKSYKDAMIFGKAFDLMPARRLSFTDDLSHLVNALRSIVPAGQIFPLDGPAGKQIFGGIRSGIGLVEIRGKTAVVSSPVGGPFEVLGYLRP